MFNTINCTPLSVQRAISLYTYLLLHYFVQISIFAMANSESQIIKRYLTPVITEPSKVIRPEHFLISS